MVIKTTLVALVLTKSKPLYLFKINIITIPIPAFKKQPYIPKKKNMINEKNKCLPLIFSINLESSFLLLAIIGGSVISTSSGFKYTRVYILLKISYQEIYRFVKPINVIDKNLYNSEAKIDDQDVKIAFLVFISFIMSIFVLSSILTLDNLTFENSFKLSILTLTNTVSSALYGIDSLNFADLNNFTKISLIFFMILGKIEIIAVIYLIKRFIFRE